MSHRVIPITGNWAPHLLAHVRSCSALVRQHETAFRGEVAFVGGKRVWAVATLRDVKPVSAKGATGFLWCFEGLTDVDGVAAPLYEAPAMFQNGASLEPQMLAAGAQALLRVALGLPTEVEADPTQQVEEEQLCLFL